MNSGMVVIGAASTLAAPMHSGTREGVIHLSAAGTINGVISGSNGLTKTGVSNGTFGNQNTYTGQTTVLAGQFTVTSNVPKMRRVPSVIRTMRSCWSPAFRRPEFTLASTAPCSIATSLFAATA